MPVRIPRRPAREGSGPKDLARERFASRSCLTSLSVTVQEFFGEAQVALARPRFDVVEEDRLSEARSLGQTNAPWNRGLEHLVSEVASYVRRNLLGEIRPIVPH